jgi:hypothetical protein
MSRALTGREWRTVAGMAAVVMGLHVVGFFILIAVVAPRRYHLGSSGAFTVGLGLGLTAYTLGLRHAFDADSISAIDNTRGGGPSNTGWTEARGGTRAGRRGGLLPVQPRSRRRSRRGRLHAILQPHDWHRRRPGDGNRSRTAGSPTCRLRQGARGHHRDRRARSRTRAAQQDPGHGLPTAGSRERLRTRCGPGHAQHLAGSPPVVRTTAHETRNRCNPSLTLTSPGPAATPSRRGTRTVCGLQTAHAPSARAAPSSPRPWPSAACVCDGRVEAFWLQEPHADEPAVLVNTVDGLPVQCELADDRGREVNPAGAQLRKRDRLAPGGAQSL